MVFTLPLFSVRLESVASAPRAEIVSPATGAGSYCGRKPEWICEKSKLVSASSPALKVVAPAGVDAPNINGKGEGFERNATSSPACKGSSPERLKSRVVVVAEAIVPGRGLPLKSMPRSMLPLLVQYIG